MDKVPSGFSYTISIEPVEAIATKPNEAIMVFEYGMSSMFGNLPGGELAGKGGVLGAGDKGQYFKNQEQATPFQKE